MGCLRIKPGVKVDTLSPGGAAILGALFRTVVDLQCDLTVTSGSDGAHSGPDDPHHRGDAFDVRSKFDFATAADKHRVLVAAMGHLRDLTAIVLGDATVEELSGGFATDLFFGVLEAAGTDNEHFHFQCRRGRKFPDGALKRT